MANSQTSAVATTTLAVFKQPSEAYRDAISSPVYRLSELMFGSLLAAYVLGFLTFATATAAPDVGLTTPNVIDLSNINEVPRHIVTRFPYLFISVTYAYVTAGMYISYHTGILTMPHMPLKQLGVDFLLALAPALFFGLSMLYPMLFPLWLGLLLILVALRQYSGYKQLTSAIYYKQTGLSQKTADDATYQDEVKKAIQNLRKEFRRIIKRYPMFSSWERIPWVVVGFGVFLILGNCIVWWMIKIGAGKKEDYVFVISLTIVLGTLWYAHRALAERASLLYIKINERKEGEAERSSTSVGEGPAESVDAVSQGTKPKPKLDERFDALVTELREEILKYEQNNPS